MTLLDNREGVTTISDVLATPFNPDMLTQVRRFGFEYEMLPTRYGEDYDPDEDPGEGCTCAACARASAEWRARREDDDDEDVPRGSQELIRRALDAGLITDGYKHDYHCRSCDACNPRRDSPLMTAQSDCSCGVEFVSRIIDLGNEDDDYQREIGDWVDMMLTWKQEGGWMPDGVTANGNHVHVSKTGDRNPWGDGRQQLAKAHITAMYAIFDWSEVADGGCGQIRGYNAKPSRHGYNGGWLSDRGYGTFEHRLWNTPSEPERLWGHLGISVGITRWAFALAMAHPDFNFTSSSPDAYYGERRISDDTFNAVVDGTPQVIEGISQYIPAESCFDMARGLILGLSPTDI